MRTRDNLVIADGIDRNVQVYDAPARQGTSLTGYGIDPELVRYWDRALDVYLGIEDWLRELLAATDLPGFTFVFNGEEVRPMFSRRSGARVAVD